MWSISHLHTRSIDCSFDPNNELVKWCSQSQCNFQSMDKTKIMYTKIKEEEEGEEEEEAAEEKHEDSPPPLAKLCGVLVCTLGGLFAATR